MIRTRGAIALSLVLLCTGITNSHTVRGQTVDLPAAASKGPTADDPQRPEPTPSEVAKTLNAGICLCGENDRLIREIAAAEVAGDYQAAEPKWRRIRDKIRSNNEENKKAAVIDFLLANNLTAQGKYAEAETLYRSAYNAQIAIDGLSSLNSREIGAGFANLLYIEGKYNDSQQIISQFIDIPIGYIGFIPKKMSRVRAEIVAARNLMAQGNQTEVDLYLERIRSDSKSAIGKETQLYRSVEEIAVLSKISAKSYPQSLSSIDELMSRAHFKNVVKSYLNKKNADEKYLRSNMVMTLVGYIPAIHDGNLSAMSQLSSYYGYERPYIQRLYIYRAKILDQLGRYSEAEKSLRDALQLSELTGAKKGPLESLLYDELGTSLMGQGRSSDAESALRTAIDLRIAFRGQKDPETGMAQWRLANLYLGQEGKGQLAIVQAREAAATVKAQRTNLTFTPASLSQFDHDRAHQVEVFRTLADADWAAAATNPKESYVNRAEAFGALQEVLEDSTSQAIALMGARNAAETASAELGALSRRRQVLDKNWRSSEAARLKDLSDPSDEASAKRQTLKASQTQIELEMGKIDSQMLRGFPGYYAMIRPTPLSIEEAQRLLAPGEAALIIVPTLSGTHAFAVSRDDIAWTRSSLTQADVTALVKHLRHDLDLSDLSEDEAGGTDDSLRYDRASAFKLYSELLGPLAKTLEGKTHLFIAADGALSTLPFAVLVTAPPTGDDADMNALRATSWLSDRFALIQLPSLQSLKYLRATRATPPDHISSQTFAGFGNPSLSGIAMERGRGRGLALVRAAEERSLFQPASTRGTAGIADVALLRTLPSLPGTAQELVSLQVALNAPETSVRLAAADTETAVRTENLANANILAFATHGLMAGQIDGVSEPGLVFTPPAVATDGDDGFLTASEITGLNLKADWVILSACNTAAGEGNGGKGLTGMARAFFYAGAKSILASHWPVRDDVAARLTVDTVTLQSKDPTLSRAQALQIAMSHIRNDPSDPSMAHPSAWAPFTLIGTGDE